MHPRVPTSAREDAYSDSLPLYSPLYSYPSYSRGALNALHNSSRPHVGVLSTQVRDLDEGVRRAQVGAAGRGRVLQALPRLEAE